MANIKAISREILNRVRANCASTTLSRMKASGLKTKSMEKDRWHSKPEIFTEGTLLKAKDTVKESITTRMKSRMREIGWLTRGLAMVWWKWALAMCTMAGGLMVLSMARVSMCLPTPIDMRESLKEVRERDVEHIYGQTAAIIRVRGSMTKCMVWEYM